MNNNTNRFLIIFTIYNLFYHPMIFGGAALHLMRHRVFEADWSVGEDNSDGNKLMAQRRGIA